MVTTNEPTKIICCRIRNEAYCVGMQEVASVQHARAMRRIEVPSDEHLVGSIQLGRTEVPVYSLAARLDRRIGEPTQSKRDQREHVVVFDSRYGNCGLLVEDVSRVITIPADHIFPIPRLADCPDAGYFRGIVSFGRRLDDESQATNESPEASDRRRSLNDLAFMLSPDRLLQSDVAVQQPSRVAAPAPTQRSWTQSVPESSSARRGQVMVFTVTDELVNDRPLEFALSITQIPEITEPTRLTPVPLTPSYVIGLVNWRDRPVPILDLADFFGLSQPAGGHDRDTRLVIARGIDEVGLVGFRVQPGIRTVRLPLEASPCDRPFDRRQDFVLASFASEEQTLVMPDIDAILAGA